MTLDDVSELLAADEGLYRKLVDLRGGCSCHLRPPCFNCSEPLTEWEAARLGYEVDVSVPIPADYLSITRDLCR